MTALAHPITTNRADRIDALVREVLSEWIASGWDRQEALSIMLRDAPPVFTVRLRWSEK